MSIDEIMNDVTLIRSDLSRFSRGTTGDQAALTRLAEQVYPELRLMARRHMKNERQANCPYPHPLRYFEIFERHSTGPLPGQHESARLTPLSLHIFSLAMLSLGLDCATIAAPPNRVERD